MLTKVKLIWDWIDKLNSSTKTLIIIILLILASPSLVTFYYDNYITNKMVSAEDYSMKTGPLIKAELNNILYADKNATNVLLLNYHNTKTNPEGYSFKYLSVLGEASIDHEWSLNWIQLDYITYSSEIRRIHNLKYLRCNKLEDIKDEFPKFYSKSVSCEADGIAIYPISGVYRPLGLIVILYKEKMVDYTLGYYLKVLADPIQKISSILDYNNNRDKWK